VKPPDRLELRTLAFALLASLLLWNLPFGGVLLYPFKLLATWLHEMSHGLSMVLTGVGFDHVTIYRDTSGLAYGTNEAGPVGRAVIAAAGYMGTPLWGALLLVVTPNARLARWALLLLAALLIGTSLTVIDIPSGDTFGPWGVGAIGTACAAAALATPARWRLAIAHFVAAQSCVNSILDIRVLLRPSQVVGGKVAGASDAHNMAAATFGTTATWAVWLWAIVWLLWSLGVLYIALRLSGSRALAHVMPVADTLDRSIAPVAVRPHAVARILSFTRAPAPVSDLYVEETAGTRPVLRPARSKRAAARRSQVRRVRWFRGPGSQ
jgi:hypothetical protein